VVDEDDEVDEGDEGDVEAAVSAIEVEVGMIGREMGSEWGSLVVRLTIEEHRGHLDLQDGRNCATWFYYEGLEGLAVTSEAVFSSIGSLDMNGLNGNVAVKIWSGSAGWRKGCGRQTKGDAINKGVEACEFTLAAKP
jgi:hypothetical protein